MYAAEQLYQSVILSYGIMMITLRYRDRLVINELYVQPPGDQIWQLIIESNDPLNDFLEPTLSEKTVTAMLVSNSIVPAYKQDVTHDIVLSTLRY